jgi:hypothetical protein
MSDVPERPPREPILERLRRLGLRNDPSSNRPVSSRRHRLRMDEITFSKPNTNDTNKTK